MSVSIESQEYAILFYGLALPARRPATGRLYEEFVSLGLACGYLPHPDCCTPVVSFFLERQATNPNSTFWKTWQDVTERSQTELFIHAILHYITTYGTGYAMPAYVPNSDYASLPFSELRPILPATLSEIAARCVETLRSGVALNERNVAMTTEFIIKAVKEEGFEFDIDGIRNREAIVTLCKALRILPRNPVALLRLIVMQLTDSPLLIKSPSALERIRAAAEASPKIVGAPDTLDDDAMRGLASIFHRFKPVFLALRASEEWRPDINRLRRMANVFHRPMRPGVMEALLDPRFTSAEFLEAVERENSVWKLFRAFAYLEEESKTGKLRSPFKKAFHVRNGRVFVRSYSHGDPLRGALAVDRRTVVWDRILDIMEAYRERTGFKTVALPKDISLAVPSTEKQFIGDIPYGSFLTLGRHNFVGVYWRNEWGTHDYDLSFISLEGKKLGWNSNYKNDDRSVVFSGDMTDADPEATEMFYCRETMPDGIFKLNRYNGDAGSRARIFVGRQMIGELSRNFMVNPANIKFKADIFPESAETVVGGVFDGRLYFFSGESGDNIVSSGSTDLMALSRSIPARIKMADLLVSAGFELVDPDAMPEGEEVTPDLDFRRYTKGDLLDFYFSLTADRTE